MEAAADEYSKRLKRYVRLEQAELREGGGESAAARAVESQALARALEGCDVRVLLDERGTMVSSEEMASALERWGLDGRPHVGFAIGGASGHDVSLRAFCPVHWSLSRLTLPHELARIVLLEQLYRSMTILRGEPYHKR